LYEDKVANFWCATSILIKWNQLFNSSQLIFFSLFTTLLSFLPSLIHLYLFPTRTNTLYSLAITSLSFYFCSFQVHEKTILFPLLPISLLFCQHPLLVSWMSFIAIFSFYPLMIKDRLEVPYIASQLMFCAIVGGLIGSIPLRSETREKIIVINNNTSTITQNQQQQLPPIEPFVQAGSITNKFSFLSNYSPSYWNSYYPYISILSVTSLIGVIIIHFFTHFFPLVFPQSRLLAAYPDLLTYLYIEYSFLHFIGFFVFLNWLQFTNVKHEEKLPVTVSSSQNQLHQD